MPSTHPYEDAFPSPLDTLNFERGELQGALETGLLVLDANVLLALYGKTAQTQNAIAGLFVQAHEVGRLVVPEHSLREYLSNRAEKLAGELEALRTLKSRAGRAKGDQDLHLPDTFAPFTLAGPAGEAVERLKEADEELRKAAKDVQESLDRLIADAEIVIRERDPVMEIVRTFVDGASVVKLSGKYDEIEKEAKARLTRPPLGDKKDLNKRNGNELGDYLVWKALLQAAQARSADGPADAVFVTNDTKPNWWADKSDDGPVMPRDELAEEYRTITGGGTFHLLTLNDYLQMEGAKEEVVDEVTEEGRRKRNPESKDYLVGKIDDHFTRFLDDTDLDYVNAMMNQFHDVPWSFELSSFQKQRLLNSLTRVIERMASPKSSKLRPISVPHDTRYDINTMISFSDHLASGMFDPE